MCDYLSYTKSHIEVEANRPDYFLPKQKSWDLGMLPSVLINPEKFYFYF